METTGQEDPIELTEDLRLDLTEALEKTVHRSHMLAQNRGLRGCYIFYALPEYRRLQFGSIGRLSRFLQQGKVASEFDVDFVTTDVRADADAPPPPPGREVRTHRDITVFFSMREPS
jgi:hypothetical protein